jgi:Prophage antirepressor
MNELSVFVTPNEKKEIRVVTDGQGEPNWVAKDVAEALGYEWKGTSTISHVPQEWRGVYSVCTPSGVQEMITLSEPGLYFFLARSDKQRALPFQKWVAGQVLPSIRKTGSYSTAIPKTLPAALRAYAIEIEKREAVERELVVAEEKLEVAAPKVAYFDMVALSTTCHKIGDFAKMIDLCLPDHQTAYGKPGQVIGPNILFRILKGEKFLLHNRVPYQDHREHFELKQKGIPMGKDGALELIPVSVISVAGQLAVLKKLHEMGCTPRKKTKAIIPSGFPNKQIGLVVPRKETKITGETDELPLDDAKKNYGPI